MKNILILPVIPAGQAVERDFTRMVSYRNYYSGFELEYILQKPVSTVHLTLLITIGSMLAPSKLLLLEIAWQFFIPYRGFGPYPTAAQHFSVGRYPCKVLIPEF